MNTFIRPFLLIFFLSLSQFVFSQNNHFGIVLHGGAGTLKKEMKNKNLEKQYKQALQEALTIGYDILEKDGSSEEAVLATISFLENSPLFNAGKGSVLNNVGEVEMDAAIMSGKTLDAGAVSGLKNIKNPILLAQMVMRQSPHVFLYGKGAEEFGKKFKIVTQPQSYFITEKQQKSLKRVKRKPLQHPMNKKGTVGVVALDKKGDLTGGTSTGGMIAKMYGRIGDSPIIGAGTYANNRTCAISCTGTGEYFIRSTAAYTVSALMEFAGKSVVDAAKEAIQRVEKLGGSGGLIAIDKNGNVAMEFNTEGMYRAFKTSSGKTEVRIYR